MEINLNLDKSIENSIYTISEKVNVLPPAAQRIREILAILNDPRFYQALGSSEPIESIEKTEDGYLIRTANYTLEVRVIYKQGHFIGPAVFELEFSEPVYRN